MRNEARGYIRVPGLLEILRNTLGFSECSGIFEMRPEQFAVPRFYFICNHMILDLSPGKAAFSIVAYNAPSEFSSDTCTR